MAEWGYVDGFVALLDRGADPMIAGGRNNESTIDYLAAVSGGTATTMKRILEERNPAWAVHP